LQRIVRAYRDNSKRFGDGANGAVYTPKVSIAPQARARSRGFLEFARRRLIG